MPEPEQKPIGPSARPAQQQNPSKPELDWLIRTMAEDIERLKSGKAPGEKTVFIQAAPQAAPAAPPAKPEAQKPSPPPVPPRPQPLPPPTHPSVPKPVPPVVPQLKPTVVQPVVLGKPPTRVPPPPGKKPGFQFRPYLLPAAAGLATLSLAFGLVWATGILGPEPSTAPSPAPEGPSIEGPVVSETPAGTPSEPPATPLPDPLAADSQESVTATADNIFSVLTTIASKPRPAGTLVRLLTPGLGPDDTRAAAGLAQTPALATSTEVLLYFWVQKETFATTTHPSRLVALTRTPEPTPEEKTALEGALIQAKSTLFLGNTGGRQATTKYQETTYQGVTVRYVNFSFPDLTLDYAFVPQQNALLFATSREAMFDAIKRLGQ